MTKTEFKEKVEKGTIKELIKLGFSKWDKPNKIGETLMLIPGKLFDSIPKGFPIVDINGQSEKFDPKKTDNDTRFGCLAYGVLKKK